MLNLPKYTFTFDILWVKKYLQSFRSTKKQQHRNAMKSFQKSNTMCKEKEREKKNSMKMIIWWVFINLASISLWFELCASVLFNVVKRKSLVTYSFSLWPLLLFFFRLFVCIIFFFLLLKMTLQMENHFERNWLFSALNTTGKNERLLSLLLSFAYTKCLLDSGTTRMVAGYLYKSGWTPHFTLNEWFFIKKKKKHEILVSFILYKSSSQ